MAKLSAVNKNKKRIRVRVRVRVRVKGKLRNWKKEYG